MATIEVKKPNLIASLGKGEKFQFDERSRLPIPLATGVSRLNEERMSLRVEDVLVQR